MSSYELRPGPVWSNWSIGQTAQIGQVIYINIIYLLYNKLYSKMLFDRFDQYKSFDQTGQMVKLVWSNGQTGLVSPTLNI